MMNKKLRRPLNEDTLICMWYIIQLYFYQGKQEINFEADKPVEMNYDDFIKL